MADEQTHTSIFRPHLPIIRNLKSKRGTWGILCNDQFSRNMPQTNHFRYTPVFSAHICLLFGTQSQKDTLEVSAVMTSWAERYHKLNIFVQDISLEHYHSNMVVFQKRAEVPSELQANSKMEVHHKSLLQIGSPEISFFRIQKVLFNIMIQNSIRYNTHSVWPTTKHTHVFFAHICQLFGT